MEKSWLLTLVLFLSVFIFFVLVFPTTQAIDPQQSIEDIKDKIDNIPKDAEDIKDKYLKKEWTTFIAQNKLFGPFHSFFTSHQLPFTILFAEPYAVSFTFLAIVALWLFFTYLLTKPLKASELFNPPIVLLISIGIAMILAHTGVLKTLATFTLNLVLSKKEWYTRIILGIIAVLALFLARTLDLYLVQTIRAAIKVKKEHSLESSTKQTKAELRALEKGLKEGAAASKKLSRT